VSIEIIEYAQFLGMDMKEDQDLFYIAREGLKAPLPEVWKPAKNRNGDIYYINLKTKEAQWEHPCDEHYKKVYQDAKNKKKTKGPSKAVSKFKSNFPAVNSLSPSGKSSGLPVIKELSAVSRDEDDYIKRENNNIFEIQDVANQESSIDTSPKRLVNKKPYEKVHIPSPTRNAEPVFDFEIQKDDFTEVDDEYDRKFFLYKQETEKGVRKMKEDLKKQENNRNEEMEKELCDQLDDIKGELIRKVQAASKKFIEDKQNIQEDLTIEHHRNLESKMNQLDEDNKDRMSKATRDSQQEIERLESFENEKAIKEIEQKILDLKQEKEKFESERVGFEDRKKQFEENQHKQAEENKKKLIQDLQNQTNFFSIEEAQRQQQDLENYRDSLQIKLNEEKSTLLVAKQKNDTINMARNSDLKEKYERIFEIEKERIDNETRVNINKFEIMEREKKDANLKELKNSELQVMKDKKQILLQKELQVLQETYKKRLNSYELQLKEKLSKEKETINSEMRSTEEKLKFEVDDIRIDLNNREQIVKQIKTAEAAEEDVNKKVQEVRRKVEKQQIENNELRSKLESLRRSQVAAAGSRLQANKNNVKLLEDQIKQLDIRIANSPKIKDNKFYLSPASIKTSPTLNPIGNKKEFPYVKIIEDIEEIKTILTTNGDEKDYSISNSMIQYRKSDLSRLPSPKALTPHKSMFLSHVKSSSQLPAPTENKWKNIYLRECENLAETRDKIKECKNRVAKTHNLLLKKQGKLKKDCEIYRHSETKNVQKKLILKDTKQMLDKQVNKMNKTMLKLRDADLMFARKNELFKDFEQTLDYGETDYLQVIYEEYSKINVVVPLSEDNEGEEFYEVWENILENQSVLNMNNFETQEEDKNLIKSPKVLNMQDSFYFENKLQLSQTFGTKSALQYSYDNLYSALEQPKSESIFKQKNSREQHDQVSSLFMNHSSWLQDMKQKLNHQLYDKPASLPSKMAGRTLF